MRNPSFQKLAKLLVNYSTRLKKGEKVLIEAFSTPPDFVNELIREVASVGAYPCVTIKDTYIQRMIIKEGCEESIKMIADYELYRMKNMDAYIAIRGYPNENELSDVPSDKMKLYQSLWWKPVHSEQRVCHTKWVVLRWPLPSMAQSASMSTEQFEDYYFDVCTLDYGKLSKAMDPLKQLMDKTDKVRITAKDTDLTFSIKGIPTVKCDGEKNIPDGEIYTAPVKDSVNGVIQYNTPTVYQGKGYDNVKLVFKNGKIIEATGSDTERINEIFNSDEGARYVGEFAIGVNPYITKAMKDILFDEKITGSIHFTPGSSYDDAFNGNKSEVHWDLVLIQTPEYGGGEIYFDDKLIRKDGLFVLDELKGLNPDRLK